MSENIMVTEDDIVGETSTAAANLTSVMNAISAEGYFPRLSEQPGFISTVVDRCEEDFTRKNILQVAFVTAQAPQFIEVIRSGRYIQADGTIGTEPCKNFKKKQQ